MVEQLKSMKESLMACAQSQMGNLENVNAKEMGEVIDMIKDLSEAIYYCTVTDAMKERKEEMDSQEKIDSAIMADRMRSGYSSPMRMYYDEGGRRGYDHGRYGFDYGNDYSRQNGYENSGGRRGYRNEVPGNTDGRDERRGYDSGASTVERAVPSIVSDYREGRSHISRKGYMEGKENHQDKLIQMAGLEKYMKELSQDITEMINDASPEEKDMLREKLNSLSQKIV